MLFVLKSFFSLIALVFITILVHESAHYVAAVIMGVPIVSFTWLDPHYLAPAFVSGSTEYTLGVRVVSYTGWLFTVIFLLAIFH